MRTRKFLFIAVLFVIGIALYLSQQEYSRLKSNGKVTQGTVVKVVTDSKSPNITVVYNYSIDGNNHTGNTQVFCSKSECFLPASQFLNQKDVLVIYEIGKPSNSDAILTTRQIKQYNVGIDQKYKSIINYIDNIENK